MDGILDWFDANLISILNGLARGMLLFLIAAGLSLIFGLMDVLNLAHGSVFAIGTYVAWQFSRTGEGFWVSLLVAVVVGAVLGVALLAAMRPIAGRGHGAQVLVTLGLLYVLADVMTLIWGNDFLSVRPPALLAGPVAVLGSAYPAYRTAVIAFGVVVALLLWLVFERTQFGAVVRATVADEGMVRALGIDTGRVRLAVFAVGTALATLGGALAAPILSPGPGLDEEVLLLALIVVVIGGLGSLKGALIGALIVGQVQSTGVAIVPELAGFLLFGTMALILLVRPQGLFGLGRA